jgi:hypothetical protein
LKTGGVASLFLEKIEGMLKEEGWGYLVCETTNGKGK